MLRRFPLLLSLLLVVGVAAAATSATVNRSSQAMVDPVVPLPADLPVRELPVVAVSQHGRTAISGSVMDELGIEPASYDNGRLIASTSAGPLHAVLGTRGLCLLLASAVSCGSLGPHNSLVALYVSAPSGFVVGGGVTTRGVSKVEVSRLDGTKVLPDIVHGGFVVSESQRLERSLKPSGLQGNARALLLTKAVR